MLQVLFSAKFATTLFVLSSETHQCYVSFAQQERQVRKNEKSLNNEQDHVFAHIF